MDFSKVKLIPDGVLLGSKIDIKERGSDKLKQTNHISLLMVEEKRSEH